jgi:hypothetical protein
LILKTGFFAIILNIKSILEMLRGGEIGNTPNREFFQFSGANINLMEVNNGKTRNPFVGPA